MSSGIMTLVLSLQNWYSRGMNKHKLGETDEQV